MSWISKFGQGVLLLSIASLLQAQNVVINEYPFPLSSPRPGNGIAAGPDGALWFTAFDVIGRITTAGVITEYPIPTANSGPVGITTGPDGALWFTEDWANRIGRITTGGIATEYPIPTANSGPVGITAGPDGALWFTEVTAGKIGRITTAGVITEYSIPTANSEPAGITIGPDGALWFAEPGTVAGAGKIGRLTTSGVFTEYSVPSSPWEITAGPDGALWFTDYLFSRIGRITPSGISVEYAIPTPSAAWGITSGPDGALWFTEAANQIGRITTSGTITEFRTPTGNASPKGITMGPDGALWFTEWSAIGQVVLTGKPVSHVSALPVSEQVANFVVQWSGSDTGSTITSFTIYVSDNASPFTAWLTTAATQATYSGVLGHTYGFYGIAHDQAGLSENPKSGADTTTYVSAAPGDLNGDGAVNCADINIVMASFGKSLGQPGYNPVADVNHDGIVNVKDLSWVSQYLVPGTQCPNRDPGRPETVARVRFVPDFED